jgi:hypothetical protein
MDVPIWKDRVWLSLVIGPFVWMAVVLQFLDQADVHLLSLWAVGLCLSISVVSIVLPAIRGPLGNHDRAT